MANLTLFNQPPMSYALAGPRIFQANYPETAGKVFILNNPTLFSIFWKAIQLFLAENTRAKIEFVSRDYEKLLELIDEKHLDDRYKVESAIKEEKELDLDTAKVETNVVAAAE